jgi:hypothetical protein
VRAGFPAALEAVLMTALENEPANRYATMLDFGHAMVDALEDADKDSLRAYLR